jgi:hypothetical protein
MPTQSTYRLDFKIYETVPATEVPNTVVLTTDGVYKADKYGEVKPLQAKKLLLHYDQTFFVLQNVTQTVPGNVVDEVPGFVTGEGGVLQGKEGDILVYNPPRGLSAERLGPQEDWGRHLTPVKSKLLAVPVISIKEAFLNEADNSGDTGDGGDNGDGDGDPDSGDGGQDGDVGDPEPEGDGSNSPNPGPDD